MLGDFILGKQNLFKTALGFLNNTKTLVMQNNNSLKSFLERINFISDDTKYKKRFDSIIGPKIYQLHLNDYFISCAFCKHLQKSLCHDYCFSCSKKTHEECSPLLPGTFSFTGSHFDSADNEFTPWIFKTPCTNYERMDQCRYFKNFSSFNQSITVANFEALEGIFLGICRGKRPCHLCASVNIAIYNNCAENYKNVENKPCGRIINEISSKYQVILGMVKYVS